MQPYLVGIAGPSCSGKSEVARRLARILRAPTVALDHYYRDQFMPRYRELLQQYYSRLAERERERNRGRDR